MVHFVLGPKGSGKTKWLIDNANEDVRRGNEHIVFVDVDDNHIFSLDRSVRLINAMEFHIDNIEALYGFLCGIIASNYDIEKIYIDGIYKILPLKGEEVEKLSEKLNIIGSEFNTQFYMGLDLELHEIPEKLQDNCFQLALA
ncbi:MAG: hypothetical protein GXZ06_05575 [Tissierellia bacterium]|nr:hypothetical protein [Tissierellia bacterium]